MKKVLICMAAVLCAIVCEAKDYNLTYSPDSTKVAFTRDNDLWVRNVADSVETRLSFDGSELILNGFASWVYYEEIFGRASMYRAFWWSPDSRKLGFYRFDNSSVNMFPIYSPFGQNGNLNQTRYPKAGQINPEVRIGMVELENPGEIIWADFDVDSEQYFGTPFWGADSRELYVPREPRRQNTLDLYAVSVTDGSKRLVYHEEYETWLNWIEDVIFTEKGLYMARSFETGWQQIYFLSYDGKTFKRLTDGKNWNIHLMKVDEKGGDIWFSAKRDSRIHTSVYRLDRKGRITTLTDPELNVSGPSLSEDGKTLKYICSTARTPYAVCECDAYKGYSKGVKNLPVPKHLQMGVESDRPFPEIVTIQNDGYELYGLMALPKDFDASKKYPVVMTLYGGPGTAYVRDNWGDRDASNQWFYENGIISIVVDPRSSGENGRKGMDEAFRQMTVIELQDYIAWAKWLESKPYVGKIGVQGFSFGGTTTSMLVLRYPEHFCCGVAGGGVYDWTLYDSHYTERFMDTPQANPEGYKTASVLNWIDSLDPEKVGRLKLTHGTGDDNVHFQNTLQLIDALQRKGIQFDLMIYPDGMHGYRGAQHKHDQAADHEFWTRNLLTQEAK